ncbi:hypothetical protein ACV242_003441 [Peribacillus simplex]
MLTNTSIAHSIRWISDFKRTYLFLLLIAQAVLYVTAVSASAGVKCIAIHARFMTRGLEKSAARIRDCNRSKWQQLHLPQPFNVLGPHLLLNSKLWLEASRQWFLT